MSVVVNGRVPDELAVWVEEYARERGVSKSDLVVTALLSLKEDAEGGVPEIRERVRAMREASKPRPGECSCPVLPPLKYGEPEARGFSTKCPVHGGRSRVDFAGSTAARSELFRGLVAPASTRGIKPSKEKESK